MVKNLTTLLLKILMLNALWTYIVLSKQCQTCIEVKLPISASSCETKLWKFCQVSYPCTSRQTFGPWNHVGIKCDLPKFLVNHPIGVKDFFHQHLIIIKVAYYGPHKVQRNGVRVKGLLNGHALDLQCFIWKMTMATNNEAIMKENSLVNLIIWLWVKFSSFAIFKH
jgi:hypothetical protein